MAIFLCWPIIFYLQSHMLSETSTEEITHVSATEGEDVTLRFPERGKKQIINVSWVKSPDTHIATTTPDGNVDIRESHYKGRLRGSNDASLTIINVTLEDQGLYRASILRSDSDAYGQLYNLSILAKLPDNNVTRHEASIPDPCSVSCRINGSDVILNCNKTSSRDITELYDPEICFCVTRNPDCSRCVLEESCREGGSLLRSVFIMLAVVTAVFLTVTMALTAVKQYTCLGIGPLAQAGSAELSQARRIRYSELLQTSGDQEDLEGAEQDLLSHTDAMN
ncbi:uncharacterized protein LOC142109106 isoform X2 [Mixophyes fleayi]|uniref:uncharacterized protein LOC142109106 isoform X2 n=1 Tax=Mixophyes fleayi TaxID=3061075 RepID=UPI003F4DA793